MIQSRETNLGKDRVGRLFFALAVPAITSQVVNALYNLSLIHISILTLCFKGRQHNPPVLSAFLFFSLTAA